jgi:hypothetical protein
MMTGKIMVFVSGNKSEITNVAKAEGKAIVDSVRGHIGSASESPAAPSHQAPSAPLADPLDQLSRLAELRDRGVLTEDEFAAKKAQILGI